MFLYMCPPRDHLLSCDLQGTFRLEGALFLHMCPPRDHLLSCDLQSTFRMEFLTFPRKSGTITLSCAARNPSRFSKHPPAERRNPRGNQTEAIQSGAAPDRGHADDHRVPHLLALRLRPAHRPGLHGANGQRPIQCAAIL